MITLLNKPLGIYGMVGEGKNGFMRKLQVATKIAELKNTKVINTYMSFLDDRWAKN